MKMMKKLNKIAATAVCGLALVPFNISAAADDTPLFSFPFETETSEAETTAVITKDLDWKAYNPVAAHPSTMPSARVSPRLMHR